MKVDVQRIGSVDVVAPKGAMVAQDAEAVFGKVREFTRSTSPRIVLSLRDVPYMDSAALERLLDACDELGAQAPNLRLAALPATCREILELTGLSGRFRFFEDVQSAVKSFL